MQACGICISPHSCSFLSLSAAALTVVHDRLSSCQQVLHNMCMCFCSVCAFAVLLQSIM